MVTPVRAGITDQPSADRLLQRPNGTFYLAISFAVTYGDLPVRDAQGTTQPIQASLELGPIIGPNVSGFPPMRHYTVV